MHRSQRQVLWAQHFGAEWKKAELGRRRCWATVRLQWRLRGPPRELHARDPLQRRPRSGRGSWGPCGQHIMVRKHAGFWATEFGVNCFFFIYQQCGLASKWTSLDPCKPNLYQSWLDDIIPEVCKMRWWNFFVKRMSECPLESPTLNSTLNFRFLPNNFLKIF